jgi:lysyl-tRNA synthetase class 2
MSTIDDIRQGRLAKLQSLKEKGIEPFPIDSHQDATNAEAVDHFAALVSEQSKNNKPLTMVGRILSMRPQGAIIFFNFNDGTGSFQGFMKKNEGEVKEGISAELFDLFINHVDIGDFVEVSGTLFETKRGEKTIDIKSWRMLTKGLRPLPEKWHGLQDAEERFRKRYLDLIVSTEVKDRFIKRSQIITEIRSVLNKEGFLEVETPMLQHLAGGASAEPFKTHHNALDMDLYMRIAPELFLKKLLIGGFPKVYEIGRNFRNEGIDVTHNPEFTMLEYYEAWSDAHKQMKFVEKLIKAVVKKVNGGLEVAFGEGGSAEKIDFSKKFAVISYTDLLKRFALIPNPETADATELRLHATQLGVKVDAGDSREKIMDNIYKKTCRPKLIQPTFIIDYPADMLPLAKRLPENPNFVDAFQLIIGGLEMVKAFSELNDPIDQLERFAAQEKNKAAGDAEAQPNDTEYVEALEHGMPPAGGVGIGIDRLVMLLTNTRNIREVILFPTLRAK